MSMDHFNLYNIAYDALPDGLDFSGSDYESASCGGGEPAINSPSTTHREPLGKHPAHTRIGHHRDVREL